MGLFNNFPYTNFHEMNLDWIVKQVDDLVEKYPSMISDISQLANELSKRVATLEKDYDYLSTGGLEKNLRQVLSAFMPAMIYPEISDAGYIIYNIPGKWDAITFNTTGLDTDVELQPQYGHLVLSY